MSPITVSVEWIAIEDQEKMILQTSGHAPATLAIVYRRPKAITSNRWHWEACGSTWWAPTMGEAMEQAVKRLEMPSHKAWCDYAEEKGIHPKR